MEKQALEQPPDKTVEVSIPEDATLTELQQELAAQEEAKSNAQKRVDKAVALQKNITIQQNDLTQERKSAQDGLAETEQKLKSLPANAGTTTPKTLAERTHLRAHGQMLQATLDRLDKEEAWRKERMALIPLERDIAAKQVLQLESTVEAWRKAVTAKRQNDLAQQKAEAEVQARAARAFKQYANIGEHARKIIELTELRQKAAAEIPLVVKQLDSAKSRLKTLEDNFKQSRERVTVAGSTMNVGTLLRIQQKKLPNVRKLERNIHARQDEIQQLELSSFEFNDRTKELASKSAAEMVGSLKPPPDAQERVRLEAFLAELLETETSNLDAIIKDYNDLLDKLLELDKVEKQLIQETDDYSRFISEHVLWIRSSEPLWKQPLGGFQSAFGELFRADDWAGVLSTLGQDFWDSPGAWTLAIALFGLLFIQHHRMKRQIDEIGKSMNKRTITEFRPTLRVLAYTVFIALLWPAVLCWVGYRLFHQLDTPVAVAAVGEALFAMGLIFFPLELLRQSCRTNGLVQSHFTWPAPVVTMIRRNLRWLKVFAPPFAFVAALFHSAGSTALEDHESLGRACFIIAILLSALFLHRVLRPSGATFRALIAHHQGGWLERLKYVLYGAGVLIPLALAGLAVFGYSYTAEQLVSRFYATLLLTLAVLILDALILRWLLVTRRRLAMEQLRQRRQAALAQAQALEAAGGAAGNVSPVIPTAVDADDERLDVAEMNDQTRQLIRSLLFVGIVIGLWGVWVDVLPALAILKKVQIHALTIERVVEEPVKPPNRAGDNRPPARSRADRQTQPRKPTETTKKTIQVPITLADLLLAVILLIVAIGAARNLPGMLEMIVLQRLPIDNAARYAITTLAQYGLTIIGVSAAFYVVGLRWQNVQWLAAALMVGLGFGLQEIFANFFSGMIVLLERPVRVGDIVTVGSTTGIVTRIRMRATTITNWERQEMIIPNKDLITGTVLNWTLSDTIQRVFIQVGVAYGSDTEKATKVLYKVLKDHPSVMDEPAAFGDICGFRRQHAQF